MVAKATKNRKKKAETTEEINGQTELREQAAIVGRDVRDLAVSAGAAAREQVDPLEEYVREKPLKSMLIAAGVGALLGVVFLRR